jgi:cephalosporin hydroxylase
MKTLNEIYQNYKFPDGNGDKGTAHTYIDIYENLLTPYRENGNILEIGVLWGYSIRMWREYFTNGKVVGVDVEIHPNAVELLNDERYKIIHCDATDSSVLDHIGDLKFDVIVDDGSHALEHQLASFNILKHLMKPGGIYIIEDIFNIDSDKNAFLALDSSCEIIDNRHIKDRSDDVLAIYRF